MNFRLATKADIFSILNIKYLADLEKKKVFRSVDHEMLNEEIGVDRHIWIVMEIEGEIRGVISGDIEVNQGLCRIYTVLIKPGSDPTGTHLNKLIESFIQHLKNHHASIEVIYATTINLTIAQQKATLELGFKIYGIFPNLLGVDHSQLNGLSVFHMGDSLTKKRNSNYNIHPTIAPFFKIAQKEGGFEDVAVTKLEQIESEFDLFQNGSLEELPELEIIHAEKYLQKKFKHLSKNKSSVINFYPFYHPNCLITDAEENCQVFVRLYPERGFAAIIGEHVAKSYNPIDMYHKIQAILKDQNISYIEILNDAADIFGNDCILRAGFTPCCFFPSFKRQNDKRRDYVIFGKSFEYMCKPDPSSHSIYLDYYREYFKIEGRQFLAPFAK